MEGWLDVGLLPWCGEYCEWGVVWMESCFAKDLTGLNQRYMKFRSYKYPWVILDLTKKTFLLPPIIIWASLHRHSLAPRQQGSWATWRVPGEFLESSWRVPWNPGSCDSQKTGGSRCINVQRMIYFPSKTIVGYILTIKTILPDLGCTVNLLKEVDLGIVWQKGFFLRIAFLGSHPEKNLHLGLLTNFLSVPDCLICLSRIDQAERFAWFAGPGLIRLGRGAWFAWAGLIDPAPKQ